MATGKCENIYFRKYFMAVRKFTNIFVLLLILMVGSRPRLLHIKKCTDRPTVAAPKCQPSEDEPPDRYTVKKKFFINGIRGDPFGYQRAT